MTPSAQSGVLAPVLRVGRYLQFSSAHEGDALRAALRGLSPLTDGDTVVVGLGLVTVTALGAHVPGVREFPALQSKACSVPRATGGRAGLMFVAFGHSFEAFEAQMRRMAGLVDGVVDALFQMSKPVTGAYAWIPPMCDGKLDLRAVGN